MANLADNIKDMKIFRWVFVRVLVLGLLILTVLFFSNNLLLKLGIEQLISKNLGVEARVEKIRWEVRRDTLTLEGLQLLNPEGFPKAPLANISQMTLKMKLKSLIKKKITIENLDIVFREIHVLRDSQGQFNWFSLKALHVAEVGHERLAFWQAWMSGWDFEINQFILSMEKGTYTDFTRPITFRKNIHLNLVNGIYERVMSLREVVKIIGWEIIIRLDQDELKEPLERMKDKIENVLGKRDEFILQWHQEKKAILTAPEPTTELAPFQEKAPSAI